MFITSWRWIARLTGSNIIFRKTDTDIASWIHPGMIQDLSQVNPFSHNLPLPCPWLGVILWPNSYLRGAFPGFCVHVLLVQKSLTKLWGAHFEPQVQRTVNTAFWWGFFFYRILDWNSICRLSMRKYYNCVDHGCAIHKPIPVSGITGVARLLFFPLPNNLAPKFHA